MKLWIAKTLAVATAVSALGALMMTSSEADAHPFGRGRVGVYIGAPLLYSPWYYSSPYSSPYYRPYYNPYYSPYYYPPTPVVVQQQPTVYIEQSPPVAGVPAPSAAPAPGPNAAFAPPPPGTSGPQAQAQQPYWYYCQDTQTYYPHVQSCASPWQRVIPHAPR